jgi:hypothetical protein
MNDLANHDVAIMIGLDLRGKLEQFWRIAIGTVGWLPRCRLYGQVGNTSTGGRLAENDPPFSLRSGRRILPVRFRAASISTWQVRIIPQSTKAHFLHEELGDWLKTDALHVSSSQWNACQWRKSRRAISGHTRSYVADHIRALLWRPALCDAGGYSGGREEHGQSPASHNSYKRRITK